MNTAKESMMNEGGAMGSDARASATQFKDQMKDKAQNTADNVRESLEEAANRAGKGARDMYETAEHKFEDIGTTFACRVRKKPFSTVAAAVGLGFIAGVLYRR